MYPQKTRGEIMGYEWKVVPASLGATVIGYFPDAEHHKNRSKAIKRTMYRQVTVGCDIKCDVIDIDSPVSSVPFMVD